MIEDWEIAPMRRNRMPHYAPAPVEQKLDPSGNPRGPQAVRVYLAGTGDPASLALPGVKAELRLTGQSSSK